jgi:hypothetical protein
MRENEAEHFDQLLFCLDRDRELLMAIHPRMRITPAQLNQAKVGYLHQNLQLPGQLVSDGDDGYE